MGIPFSSLRDDFVDNDFGSAWDSYTIGSATIAEAGGELRITLPSSTAGTHEAGIFTKSAYDLTSDSFYVNIDTMVSTAVAATAAYDLRLVAASGLNILRWAQLSNTIRAQTYVAGVGTDQYSATWSATTYKYLRIRGSGANVLFESSTNGTSWTTRATVAVSSLFPITSLYVLLVANCGNVASPGSFRLEDVNLVLPALSTNWRWAQARWPLVNRHKRITIAIDTAGTAQGYLVTADAIDVSGNPNTNIRYWSGPANGGRELTEQFTQFDAEAMAVNLPLDGSFDLPEQIDARVFRLYARSVDGAAFFIREFFPRRLVQADDIEAESIRALHIAAEQITGTHISAILDVTSKRFQTAWNGARVVLSGEPFGGFIGYGATDTYDTTTGAGTYQVLWKLTDGKFYAGAGAVRLDATGIDVNVTGAYDVIGEYKFNSSGSYIGGLSGIYGSNLATTQVKVSGIDGNDDATVALQATSGDTSTTGSKITATAIYGFAAAVVTFNLQASGSIARAWITGADSLDIESGGLNVGGATGAASGEIKATVSDAGTTNVPILLTLGHNSSGTPAANFGSATLWNLNSSTTDDQGALQVNVSWVVATHASRTARARWFVYDTAAREILRMEASGSASMLSFHASAAIAKPTVTGSRGANAALASLLTALANYGLVTDSST